MAIGTKNLEVNKQKQVMNGSDKKNGLSYGILVFVIALVVMLIILWTVFYFIIHNNVNGLGERYRENLQGIPILRTALPAVADPEDPKHLTERQLIERYNQLRITRDSLQVQLDTANSQISELNSLDVENHKLATENESIKKMMEDQNARLEAEKKQIDLDRINLASLAAKKDTDGFRAYYEKIDKESAEKIYTEIIKEQKLSEDTKKFIQIYETMEPASAADIFKELSSTDMDLVIDILKTMKKDNSASILSELEPELAAKLTTKLSEALIDKRVDTRD